MSVTAMLHSRSLRVGMSGLQVHQVLAAAHALTKSHSQNSISFNLLSSAKLRRRLYVRSEGSRNLVDPTEMKCLPRSFLSFRGTSIPYTQFVCAAQEPLLLPSVVHQLLQKRLLRTLLLLQAHRHRRMAQPRQAAQAPRLPLKMYQAAPYAVNSSPSTQTRAMLSFRALLWFRRIPRFS